MLLADVALIAVAALTLLLLISAIWHLFVRVPFVPTPKHIIDAMIGLIDWKGDETVFDLGAGDGRVLETIKKRHPKTTAIGCEIVPTVWLLGFLRSLIKRSGVRITLQSMFTMDVSEADVVVLYLFPGLIKRLEEKFDRELKPGTRVLCHTFGFHNRTPENVIDVPRLGGTVKVFLYRWKASA